MKKLAMKNNELTEKVNFPEERDTGRTEYTGLAKLFFDEGYKKGFKIGYEEVREKRREEGREEEKASVVLTMLMNGFDYMTICTVSRYPEAKVKELRDRFIREGLLPA